MSAIVLVATPDNVLAEACRSTFAAENWLTLCTCDAENGVRLGRATAVDVLVADDRLSTVAGFAMQRWLGLLDCGPTKVLTIGGPNADLVTLQRPVTATSIRHAIQRQLHPAPAASDALKRDGMALDPHTMQVRGPGGIRRLTAMEYRLMSTLVATGGQLVPTRELASITSRSSVRVHLSNLRSKLASAAGDQGRHIVAGRGGYRIAGRWDERPL